MTTLGQIVGIHKGTKTQIQRDYDEIYHKLQKADLFTGFEKTHTAFEGTLPKNPDSRRVQANSRELLTELRPLLTRLIDLEATKDDADTRASADVILPDGTVLLRAVPVSHLLWLEKQANNFLTVFRAIPVLSAAEAWQQAQELPEGMLKTQVEDTPSTTKVEDYKVIVPAAANGNHPADVRKITEDKQTGTYHTVKYTTALPPRDKAALVRRASALLDALRQAIVLANHLQVEDKHEGAILFDYLYAGVIA